MCLSFFFTFKVRSSYYDYLLPRSFYMLIKLNVEKSTYASYYYYSLFLAFSIWLLIWLAVSSRKFFLLSKNLDP